MASWVDETMIQSGIPPEMAVGSCWVWANDPSQTGPTLEPGLLRMGTSFLLHSSGEIQVSSSSFSLKIDHWETVTFCLLCDTQFCP